MVACRWAQRSICALSERLTPLCAALTDCVLRRGSPPRRVPCLPSATDYPRAMPRQASRQSDAQYARIHAAVAAIPAGRVASYGAIAARAGLPGRARMVGRALGCVPDGMQLPWHRVLRADGRIALPPGSRSFREQCRRLRAEGVEVSHGRVPMAAFGLHHDLDRALWGDPRTDVGKR